MVISDRTKGCCSSDLNEPPHPNHDQFAELDAHNSDEAAVIFVTLATAIGSSLKSDGRTPCSAVPSVPMKVRHLSPGIFRLEGAEGSSHSCPCSRSRLIQQVAPSRSVCADRRLYRRHALRHPNSPIARGDGRSLPRTSCAS